MQDQRDPHRFPGAARQLRANGGGRSGERLAGNVREVDAAPLEKIAFFDQSGNAAATLRALPAVGAEGLAVESFKLADDAALQAGKVILEAGGIHVCLRWMCDGRLIRANESPAVLLSNADGEAEKIAQMEIFSPRPLSADS